MKKAIVHYFSGTGNSLLAAKTLGRELSFYGYEMEYHSVEEGVIKNPGDYELHIFSFPVYATNVPHIMRKYIRMLPKGNKAKTVVLCNIGRTQRKSNDGYQGWALHQARLYLRMKDYDVFYSERLFYPHNITIAIPPCSKEDNQLFISEASAGFPEMAKQIAGLQRFHRGFFYPNFLWSILFGVLYTLVGRHFFGKLLAVDESCTGCKLCQEQCPSKSIKTGRNGNWWSFQCEGCLRCMNICPKHSIQTSIVRILLLTWATFYNPLFLIVYRSLPDEMVKGNIGTAAFCVLLYTLSVFLFVGIMDIFLYLLSYIPFFRKIISFGHTRFYGRYQAKQYEDKFLNK